MEIPRGIDDIRYLMEAAVDIRYDADDSAPTYIGLCADSMDSATSSPNWIIFKFTYSGSNVTRIQKAKGAWDDRATLF